MGAPKEYTSPHQPQRSQQSPMDHLMPEDLGHFKTSTPKEKRKVNYSTTEVQSGVCTYEESSSEDSTLIDNATSSASVAQDRSLSPSSPSVSLEIKHVIQKHLYPGQHTSESCSSTIQPQSGDLLNFSDDSTLIDMSSTSAAHDMATVNVCPSSPSVSQLINQVVESNLFASQCTSQNSESNSLSESTSNESADIFGFSASENTTVIDMKSSASLVQDMATVNLFSPSPSVNQQIKDLINTHLFSTEEDYQEAATQYSIGTELCKLEPRKKSQRTLMRKGMNLLFKKQPMGSSAKCITVSKRLNTNESSSVKEKEENNIFKVFKKRGESAPQLFPKLYK